MRKIWWLFDVLLLATSGGLGWRLHSDWHSYTVREGPQAIKARPVLEHANSSVPPIRDYGVIAQQNPFNSERNDVVVQNEPATPTGPLPLVYGSMILGKERFALLGTDQSPKEERVDEGASFQGYRLVQVLPQSVVFESPAGREEIKLYNALERLHRQASKTAASAARPPAAPPAIPSASSSGSTSEVATTGAAPPSQPTPEAAAPAGKQWMPSPFGPILVDKRP